VIKVIFVMGNDCDGHKKATKGWLRGWMGNSGIYLVFRSNSIEPDLDITCARNIGTTVITFNN